MKHRPLGVRQRYYEVAQHLLDLCSLETVITRLLPFVAGYTFFALSSPALGPARIARPV
jgi:hypothetical protein